LSNKYFLLLKDTNSLSCIKTVNYNCEKNKIVVNKMLKTTIKMFTITSFTY